MFRVDVTLRVQRWLDYTRSVARVHALFEIRARMRAVSSSLLKSRAVWIACFASWLGLGLFVFARDLVMVGPQAPGFAREEMLTFIESMVLWGLISPFIIV